jgi:hypothetical protein
MSASKCRIGFYVLIAAVLLAVIAWFLPTSFWQRTVSDPIALYTSILAIFTIILAGASIWQGRLTKRSIDLARSEFDTAHPPELVMRDVRWKSIEEGEACIAFTLANRGGSTASTVESIFRVKASLNPVDIIDPDEVNELPLILQPGEFRAITTLMVSDGEKMIAEAAKMAILEDHYFRGTVVYTSPMGIRRRMVFARECKRGQLHFQSVDDTDLDYTD